MQLSTMVVIGVGLATTAAHAQSSTSGAIEGRITEAGTGDPIAGVTITVRSDARGNAQSTRTTADGTYRVTQLAPGDYVVVIADDVVQPAVVRVQRVTPVYAAIGRRAPPAVDPTSTELGIAIDRNGLTNVPLPGRGFEAAIGRAPGARSDQRGTAYAGSQSLENRYVIDGIDSTESIHGGVGTPMPWELLAGVAVTTGGLGVESGRVTGGLVTAVTRSGTDQLHGSVFATVSPSWLRAPAKQISGNAGFDTIEVTRDGEQAASFGAELGGPVIRDRMWFYLGFAPQVSSTDYARTIRSRIDCHRVRGDLCAPELGDGAADIDPDTGEYLTQIVDSEIRSTTERSYLALGKLDVALTPRDQGSVSLVVVPSTGTQPELVGVASSGTRTSGIVVDGGARWSSKLRGDALEVEGAMTWHHASQRIGAIDPAAADVIGQQADLSSLDANSFGGQSPATIRGCADGGTGDMFPHLVNCPLSFGYRIGGPGALSRTSQDRGAASVAAIYRPGRHEIKVGADVVTNDVATARWYSGGAFVKSLYGIVNVTRFVKLAAFGDPGSEFAHSCAGLRCRYTTSADPATTDHEEDWSAYLRDAWQPRPDLRITVGLRYESQRLTYGSDLRGKTDVLTGTHRGDTALRLAGNVAPRIGVVYDPTAQGKARVFAHWGRYFESIGMNLSQSQFGTTPSYEQSFRDCPRPLCLDPEARPFGEYLIGTDYERVAPGTKAGYLDELVTGVEGEIAADLVLGLTYQRRRLGRVVEDVVIGGALVIANPGEGLATSVPRPMRDHDALSLTVAHHGSQGDVAASYTYSRTRGDYEGGLLSTVDQLAPNQTEEFDRVEGNRRGVLALDRPHVLKLDAYHLQPIGRSTLVLGARFRVSSGAPEQALGAHYLYGADATFLLPRGQFGRTDLVHVLDLHIGFKRQLTTRIGLEVYADIFNVYDHQGTASVDDTYASQDTTDGRSQNANPISGGTYEDLIWLKAVDLGGQETATAIGRNPKFHATSARYAPTSATLGFRLSF